MSNRCDNMFKWRILFCFALLNILSVHCMNLEYLDPRVLQTKTSADVQQKLAQKIIDEFAGDGKFQVTVDFELFKENKDSFKLKSTSDHTVEIRASSGVAAVWGFHYYVKKYCKFHVGWQVRNILIPEKLPTVDEEIVASDRFRYYQNVCTVSYSFVWWSEDEWYEHIKWMALNGINLALAPFAQESISQRVYRKYNLTDDDIDEHFTGPAFLSWLRMGNLRNWGGPLPKSWHNRAVRIQHFIVKTMNQIGMVPVLPAFAGHVPQKFGEIYPNVKFHRISEWGHFTGKYCCPLLVDPKEGIFKKLGVDFLKEMTNEFGVNHIYSADPFNEIQVANMSGEFVQEVSRSIQTALDEVDKKSVWLLQNWMLVDTPGVWSLNLTKAFLESVPKGRLLILDLQSEQFPMYYLHNMYYGHPFIWCMLHNFGGTLGMFGSMDIVNTEVHEARKAKDSSMLGIGLTMEGINQNYVVYDLMLESGWRKDPHPNLENWVSEYAVRRYGINSTRRAWKYLLKSVYNFRGQGRVRGKYVLTRKPRDNIVVWSWYSNDDLTEAWKNFLMINKDDIINNAFKHDLVDITRQVLQYRIDQVYLRILETFFQTEHVNQFLELMDDLAEILASHEHFSAIKWISGAKKAGEGSASEALLYELNAKNQITLWGPNGEINDYACKQWAEVVGFYYKRRWELYFNNRKHEFLRQDDVFQEIAIKEFYDFDINTIIYRGDSLEISRRLFMKWAYVPGLKELPIIGEDMFVEDDGTIISKTFSNHGNMMANNWVPSVNLSLI